MHFYDRKKKPVNIHFTKKKKDFRGEGHLDEYIGNFSWVLLRRG